ncbi:branched-chain amino acid ABC transporter ATP-binding protein/permease [Bosea sp. (in: a-proteobacteria)]|mgnify:CR=1 FL=1|uniref:branched-chain amino acid ABC transporter ATP-binding protein/permease n=1 Tax=Bosea sp. (in: a-proteobacteria) TaxID=1871050 RepID=UPI001AC9AD38|nr:branched-chain amino acid ABC transporter ATP-binding protein/permease [Bosea sp. (in: a-proteobacteria)]MBN9439300.1 branched-chain amino acid ABC transporter ATP-binding protein/permease [Bosea sp. (in: a-proteobacteria)]
MTSQTAIVASVVAPKPSPFAVLTHPRVYCALLLLSLLLIVPALSGSAFIIHVFVTICVFAGLSTAWNIVGGYAGQLSLGHMMFYGIGGYTTALLIQHFGLSPWIGMWAGAALSALVAVCIGYPCFRLRGPFFALATIAFLEVVRLLAIHFHGVTGGSAGLIVPLKLGWAWMIFQDKFNYLIIAFGLLLLTLIVSYIIRNARLGYYLTAVREREDAASAAGINPTTVKLKAVIVSAVLTSLIGSFHAMYTTFLEPATMFSLSTSIEIAMFSLIGGLGTVVGPLLGTVLVVPLAELARGWLGAQANGLHGFVYGTVLVLITLTLPGGLVGTFGVRVGRWVDRLPGGQPRPEQEAPALRQITGAPGETMLATKNLVMRFGGLTATDNVSMVLKRGEILGIIGPNGAGKTTLFNQISGFLQPSSGSVAIVSDGQETTPATADAFARAGVGRTFQIVQPFGKLTVIENIMIGAFMRHPDVASARAVALRVSSLVGLQHVREVEARNLPIGDLKRLEVARTLATEPDILLLDEVMAGQSQADTQKMVELIRAVRDAGVTVIAIEHNMQAIMSLSDRIIVIDSGKVIAQGDPQAVVRDRRVIEAYLGEDFANAQGL